MNPVTQYIIDFANFLWTPTLALLLIGGVFFLIYSGFIPFRFFGHAIDILRGKYDDPNAPGQINHYEALSTSLASTVGMGNISGVALAIAIGGPGAMFWMWVSAFVGMATNFFSSTAAMMYRGKDSAGEVQGGPMYVIVEAMGKQWKPLASLFAFCALFGCLPVFQANQLTQAIRDIILVPNHWEGRIVSLGFWQFSSSDFIIGVVVTIFCALVILGGIQRIGKTAGKFVPIMIVIYFLSVLGILIVHYDAVPYCFKLMVTDAFAVNHYHGSPILGGLAGGLIVLGFRRATFSNEAGLGTAPMAMGAAKSSEPVQDGLVAMLSPAIDTLLVCTLTALAILVTGVWETSATNGVTLTANAFESVYPGVGKYLLMISSLTFAIAALFSYSYYGAKSLSFLIGAERAHYYNYVYLGSIIFACTSSLMMVVSLIDAAFALMAYPTMIYSFYLAPRVLKETKLYFKKLKESGK
ncbi:MAG TPA: alanine/glycine:cation symporter family protein [Cyclobacteriaceae bacterium]|nr:alanine/glycine:cation symporter family protein [Cyclobacteriaceae bacterium]